jgi:hypothetical protein
MEEDFLNGGGNESQRVMKAIHQKEFDIKMALLRKTRSMMKTMQHETLLLFLPPLITCSASSSPASIRLNRLSEGWLGCFSLLFSSSQLIA